MKKDFSEVSEEQLVLYLQNNEDAADEMHELCERYQGLIRKWLSELNINYNSNYYEDCLQQAYMYLIETIDKYEFDRDVRFVGYAMSRIPKKLKSYYNDLKHNNSGVLTTTGVRTYVSLMSINISLRNELNREPTEKEIIDAYREKNKNNSDSTLREKYLTGLIRFGCDSLNTPLEEDDEDCQEHIYYLQNKTKNPEKETIEKMTWDFLLEDLPDKHKKVWRMEIDGFKRKEIADAVGYTHENMVYWTLQTSKQKIIKKLSQLGINKDNFRGYL